jgi:hypothetical protein
MTILKLALCALLSFGAVGLAQAGQAEETPAETVTRIGVYDSRSIAIAYAGTEIFSNKLQDLRKRHDEAKAAGDEELTAELAGKGHAMQELMHRQGFSTAPVDDILEHIKDKIPGIMESHGVNTIVSKWDEEALACHESAEQVDLTMELVMALNPNEVQAKHAREIMKTTPVPLEELEKKVAGESE